MKQLVYLFLFFSVLLFSSCPGETVEKTTKKVEEIYDDATTKALRVEKNLIDALEKALSKFEDQSNFWREDLKEAQDKLTDDLKDIIGYDLDMLVKSSVAELDQRFKCNIDFFRDRITLKLRSMIRYLKTPRDERDVNMLHGSLKICSTIPKFLQYEKIINNETKVLTVTGYDMLAYMQDVKLRIRNNKNKTRIINLQDPIGNPDPYTLTINLSSSGIKINEDDVLLILESSKHAEWPINITKNHMPICKTKEEKFTPNTFQYFPKTHTNDNDFGNQPVAIKLNYNVLVNPSTIELKFFFEASEQDTYPQHQTVVQEEDSHIIYRAPKNWIITDHNLFNLTNSISFEDRDKVHDEHHMGGGAVSKITIDVNQKGPDIGVSANVKFDFNAFKINLKQSGNCKN